MTHLWAARAFRPKAFMNSVRACCVRDLLRSIYLDYYTGQSISAQLCAEGSRTNWKLEWLHSEHIALGDVNLAGPFLYYKAAILLLLHLYDGETTQLFLGKWQSTSQL